LQKVRHPILFFSFLFLLLLESEIRELGYKKNGIRDKPPGIATLVTSLCFGAGQAGPGESRGDVNASERQVFFYVQVPERSFMICYRFLLISKFTALATVQGEYRDLG
jgi:hypothetical protein